MSLLDSFNIQEYLREIKMAEKEKKNFLKMGGVLDRAYCVMFEHYLQHENNLKIIKQAFNGNYNPEEKILLEELFEGEKQCRYFAFEHLNEIFKLQRDCRLTKNLYVDSQLRTNEKDFIRMQREDFHYFITLN